MSGQGLAALILVLTAAIYLIWQLGRRAKPAPGGGGCACCNAGCAARGARPEAGEKAEACPDRGSE